jgi:hypothetical protein
LFSDDERTHFLYPTGLHVYTLLTYRTSRDPSTSNTIAILPFARNQSQFHSAFTMSVQDRAQAQLSQLDKEVSALASAHGTIVKIQSAHMSSKRSHSSSNMMCTVLTISCSSCPSTPLSTTLRSKPPSPRSTSSSVSPASTSS